MAQPIFTGINENIIIKCLDENMNVVGYVDEFRSLTWGYSWSNIGNWTLIADRTSIHTINVLQASAFVMIQNIPSSTLVKGIQTVYGIINRITTQHRPSGDTVTFTGYELKALARRRIVLTKETYPEESRKVIATLIDKQICNPNPAGKDATQRKILGGVDGETYCKSTETTEEPEQYTNVGDCIINIAEAAELGWHAVVNDSDGGVYWFVTDGVDRTLGQHEREPMLLDFTYETIDEATYEINIDGQNAAYVGGKESGSSRKIETAYFEDGQISGYHRNEIFVDARNEEAKALKGKGEEALNEYSGKTTIKIVPSFAFLQRFGGSYNLGDVGTFVNLNNLNMRLTAAELNFENNSVKGNFTFGYDKATIKGAMNVLLRSYKNMLNY